jgi:hypothetical protein
LFFISSNSWFVNNAIVSSLSIFMCICKISQLLFLKMASCSTGGCGTSSQCAGCHKIFRRLSTHIAQSPICEQLYTTSHHFISSSVSNNVVTQSSTWRRSRPCLSNDLPSVTHPHVGSFSSIWKTANGPLAGERNVQSSRGHASSGIATSQEQILDDKLDDRNDVGNDALHWNNWWRWCCP